MNSMFKHLHNKFQAEVKTDNVRITQLRRVRVTTVAAEKQLV